MTFKKGHDLSTGRPPGSLNKRRQSLHDKAEQLGVDPFEILLLFAKGDWKTLGEVDGIPTSVRADCAAEACAYLYTRLKPTEEERKPGGGLLGSMSEDQKLEMAKYAVKILESKK